MRNPGTHSQCQSETAGTKFAAFTSIHNRGIGVKKHRRGLAPGIVATEHRIY